VTAIILEHATAGGQSALDQIVKRFPWMGDFDDFVLHETGGASPARLNAVERSLNAMSYEVRDLLRYTEDPKELSARLVELYSALRDAALRTLVAGRLDKLGGPHAG